MSVREPVLVPVAIGDLRPTQITVGMREVDAKRRRWRDHGDTGKAKFLGSHMIPVLLGPKERRYVIDHHHLVRALHEEGATEVLTNVVADLRHLTQDAFWVVADHRGWVHPYDASGVRRAIADLPKHVRDLDDDPFRSLAGELRRSGGFAKDTTPFSEFLWADSCAGGSGPSSSRRISWRLCARPCNSPRSRTPPTCRAGAGPSSKADRRRSGGVFR